MLHKFDAFPGQAAGVALWRKCGETGGDVGVSRAATPYVISVATTCLRAPRHAEPHDTRSLLSLEKVPRTASKTTKLLIRCTGTSGRSRREK